jgi:hypothetical protein
VAGALARWHERGKTAGDLSFWREHLEGFQSPKAFALVVDALLRKQDYRAAMALLINWLGQVEQVPLEDGDYSFQALALRWMLGIAAQPGAAAESWPLVRKFFDYLEANADEYWEVPSLELHAPRVAEGAEEDEESSLYSAAYADVTYHDSADDNQEGAVADGQEFQEDFDLEVEGERLTRRLRFLSLVAQLWQLAARQALAVKGASLEADPRDALQGWQEQAQRNHQDLLLLLDAIQEHPIPEALGSHDSLVEYDRRRSLKEHLLYTTIGASLDSAMAVGTLDGTLGTTALRPDRPAWEGPAIQLEQALLQGDAARARELLPKFLGPFQEEPLLFTALTDGGTPRQILRVRLAQTILRALVTNLPRLGLLRETYHLLRAARAMELRHRPPGRGVSEFNHLFQAGFQAVVEAVVESQAAQSPAIRRSQELVDLLEGLTRPFLSLWVEHSQTLQLSALEAVSGEEPWEAMRTFVQRYGSDLFHAKFMTLGNLRGILLRGVGPYLDYLRDNPDPLHSVRLIEELDQPGRRDEALRLLPCILQALIENYEEYKDYNTTTPQSDYGENLHLLLDFLRLKVSYERHAWRLRPLTLAHEILARSKRIDLAVSWQEAFTRLTNDLAGNFEQELARLEQAHGMRLRTVADRIHERFVKPLALDRLCALIEPAMLEARERKAGRAFAQLEKELLPLTESPTGVGLDVPQWLLRLAAEVQRVRAAHTNVAQLAEGHLRVPRIALTLPELRQQLKDEREP